MILFVLLLAACGGASAPASGPIIPAPAVRRDLLFGYYGKCDPRETMSHTNLCWESGWDGLASILANLRAASGMKIVLQVPAYHPDAENEVRFLLTRIRDAGLLNNIAALYPQDEPDVHGISDAQVVATNAMVRKVMSEFPELKDTVLAVIYGNGGFPGISSYDWIGRDQYGLGCYEATGQGFKELKAKLRPDQKLMLVPGGADPWRQDPACFESVAHGDTQVVAIVPFLWADVVAPGVGLGIRSNGMKKLYCDAGHVIMGLEPCA